MEHDPADRLPAMAEVYERGISVSGMSKPWGGCGITVGWIVTRDAALRTRLMNALYFGSACMCRCPALLPLSVPPHSPPPLPCYQMHTVDIPSLV